MSPHLLVVRAVDRLIADHDPLLAPAGHLRREGPDATDLRDDLCQIRGQSLQDRGLCAREVIQHRGEPLAGLLQLGSLRVGHRGLRDDIRIQTEEGHRPEAPKGGQVEEGRDVLCRFPAQRDRGGLIAREGDRELAELELVLFLRLRQLHRHRQGARLLVGERDAQRAVPREGDEAPRIEAAAEDRAGPACGEHVLIVLADAELRRVMDAPGGRWSSRRCSSRPGG